jgi:hypothetical protein
MVKSGENEDAFEAVPRLRRSGWPFEAQGKRGKLAATNGKTHPRTIRKDGAPARKPVRRGAGTGVPCPYGGVCRS